MVDPSTRPYRFGDLLALARRSWVAQLAAELAAAGYDDYRRTDAATVRLLRRGPLPVGRLGDILGVTRQAARKIVAGLERRGFATARRDERDARQLDVALTPAGQDYADALAAAIGRLDVALAGRVTPEQLAATDAVLRTVLVDDERGREVATRVAPPTPRPTAAAGS